MFSGIVESVEKIKFVYPGQGSLVRIHIPKPVQFDDLKIGDSIAVNGICLTIEKFDQEKIEFALAAETLKVIGKTQEQLLGQAVNLERSLRFGDRIHGHLVTGHVDSLGFVKKSYAEGENWFLDVEVSADLKPLIWKKGSITLNGVALTINQVQDCVISVCLIPETVKRTNLASLIAGDCINVEADYLAKALFRSQQVEKESHVTRV